MVRRLTPIEKEKAKLLIRARAFVNVEIAELRLDRKYGFVADVEEAFDAALRRGETLPTIDLDTVLQNRKKALKK